MNEDQRSGRKKTSEKVRDWCTENGLPSEFLEKIPTRYIRFGSTLIFRFRSGIPESYERLMAEGWIRILKAKTGLKRTGIIHGEYREPELKRLVGEGGEITHYEYGVRYVFDPEKVMFSPGNHQERLRMLRMNMKGETVVDMFAGIGYFSLPIALNTGAEKVYSCEINPRSFSYLEKNIRINKAKNIIPVLGDNREVAPSGIADRIIMGYVGTTHLFLEKAFSCLKPVGLIHYHEVCPLNHYPDATQRRLETAADSVKGVEVEVLKTDIVKSYGPKMLHVVADVKVEKDASGKKG